MNARVLTTETVQHDGVVVAVINEGAYVNFAPGSACVVNYAIYGDRVPKGKKYLVVEVPA